MKRIYILILLLLITIGYILANKYNKFKMLNLKCNFLTNNIINIDDIIKIKLKKHYCYNMAETTNKITSSISNRVLTIDVVNALNSEVAVITIIKYNNIDIFNKLKNMSKNLVNCKVFTSKNTFLKDSFEFMQYPYRINISANKDMLYYLGKTICENIKIKN